MKGSLKHLFLLMMLIFLKLEYCRVAAMDSPRGSNATLSISNATKGCIGSIHDCSNAIDDDDLSLFIDDPLRRMLTVPTPEPPVLIRQTFNPDKAISPNHNGCRDIYERDCHLL
ncbi:hypothetical protein L6164_023426 [Bauhinia variegata]|uniref:Uncharacterized protein n=1 Tax=Bauhinia variegata TaxID=167791 RepID=A0ACB9MLJ2_BAUVA|nr:hypothetical protein L6164_023426 [Bauhinia variegata]